MAKLLKERVRIKNTTYSKELEQNFKEMQGLRQALAELGYGERCSYGGRIVGEMTGAMYSNLDNGVCVELKYSNKSVAFSYVVPRTVFTLASPELHSRQNDPERFKKELQQFENVAEKLL